MNPHSIYTAYGCVYRLWQSLLADCCKGSIVKDTYGLRSVIGVEMYEDDADE